MIKHSSSDPIVTVLAIQYEFTVISNNDDKISHIVNYRLFRLLEIVQISEVMGGGKGNSGWAVWDPGKTMHWNQKHVEISRN